MVLVVLLKAFERLNLYLQRSKKKRLIICTTNIIIHSSSLDDEQKLVENIGKSVS